MADGHTVGERAKFREMLEGTKEDWETVSYTHLTLPTISSV